MDKRYERKRLSEEQIGRLAANTGVLYVGETTLVLTLDLRQRLYDMWEQSPLQETVRSGLLEEGIDVYEAGDWVPRQLISVFRRCGRPTRTERPSRRDPTMVPGAGLGRGAGAPATDAATDAPAPYREARRELIGTGDFVATPTGRLWPAPELEDALFAAWPGTPVSDGLAAAGYGEAPARADLCRRLEAEFAGAAACGTSPAESRREHEALGDGAGVAPVVPGAAPLAAPDGRGGVAASASLAASVAPLLAAGVGVDEALDAHLVDHRLLSVAEKRSLLGAALAAEPAAPDLGGTVLEAEVLRRRADLMERSLMGALRGASESVAALAPSRRKEVCLWAASLPPDPTGRVTRGAVREALGISSSSYYRHVGDESWGTSEERRAERDAEDAAAVAEAFGHRGFRKGARQVYMLIPRLGHRKVGLRRVRRLMREQGLESGVRGPNPSRRSAASHEAEAVAPDLLRRRFRLHRPNEVRVTDVTTLDCAFGRAYGSALMDPVTSVLVALVVSDRNDLALALDTLRAGDGRPCEDGGILHSDQGVLYKAGGFRAEVLDRGLSRSMSKRGNCWDNAPVESFFGHLKDECDYAPCATLGELRALADDYADYYNRERGQWSRMRMTPVEYEAWLSSLTDAEFEGYLAREEAEWDKMRARAAELAKRRYGTLGATGA